MDPENYYFTELLRERYEVEISDTPDYLFYSVFGNKQHEYDCLRIFLRAKIWCRILTIAIMRLGLII